MTFVLDNLQREEIDNKVPFRRPTSKARRQTRSVTAKQCDPIAVATRSDHIATTGRSDPIAATTKCDPK